MGLVMPKTKKKLYLIITCAVILAFFGFQHFFIFPSQSIHIPLTFTPSGTPVLLASIEGEKVLLQLDLGSKCQLSLRKDILESIKDKRPYEAVQWRDAKGNSYESPSYLIPRVKIGELSLTNIIARQELDVYRINTTLWNDNKDEVDSTHRYLGRIGRPLLEKANILLDFRNSMIIVCKNAHQIKKLGFSLSDMIPVPFEGGAKGIIIKADTDAGLLRLALDTGTTITLVRASCLQNQKCAIEERGFSVFTTQKFFIGNNDFGNKNLFLYDITSELNDIDGVLGMDFLKNHVIYIDYEDKMIYIENSKR